MTSVVYFIRNTESGLVKIGWTADLNTRVSGLSGASGAPLVVLATAPGARTLEAHLHARFAAVRVRGEWFKADRELLDLVARLQRGESGIFPAGLSDPKAEKPLALRELEPSVDVARRLIRRLGSERGQSRKEWATRVARKIGVTANRAYDLMMAGRVHVVSADELRAIRLAVRKQGRVEDLQAELTELLNELDDVVGRLERAKSPAGRIRGLAASDGLSASASHRRGA